MLDKNYLLRDGTTSVTGTENGTTFDVGMDLVPQTYMLNLPSVGTTITVVIQESDDNTNWRTVATFGEGAGAPITAAGQFFLTFKSNARYRRMAVTVATGTWPNVLVAAVPAGRYTNF